MRDQAARDEQTVTIATALAAFLGTLAGALALWWLLGRVADLSPVEGEAAWACTLGAAALVAGVYVARHRH